jgi:hypothetical protein
MLKKLLKHPYLIAGVICFVLLFVIGLGLGFPLSETLLGAAVLTLVGVGVIWWRMEGFG